MGKKLAGDALEIADHIKGSVLLGALKDSDIALLMPYFKVKNFEKGQVLCEPGDRVLYAYFPCDTTLISLRVFLEDDRGVEAVVIGREGAAGGIVSQGHLPAYCQFLVQSSGKALYISCADLERAKEKSMTLHHFFARYADCLLAQMFQAVACNATHTIEQRAAKWIAAAHDRTGDDSMTLTQDNLATLLGVGRSYVAKVMSGLKKNGALETSRGQLTIRDPKKLKKLACGCDDMVRSHFQDVLGGIYPARRTK
ncbi:MAG: cAMP-binding protein [Alphaproteobacteria bacterium]|jgi:CRP-like cAMP-binding protein|nr:cAMP-binding protein [Alphaproteobacteria bacterium]